MEFYAIKEIQAYEYVSFTQFKPVNELNFCCEKFNRYVSSMDVWDRTIGKLCVVNNNSLVPIDFCPFCGEGIKYIMMD
jgi:hypothetical protein